MKNTRKQQREFIKAAAKALSDLNVFYIVINILDSSFVSADCHDSVQKIVKICKQVTSKKLDDYDDAVMAAGGGKHGEL